MPILKKLSDVPWAHHRWFRHSGRPSENNTDEKLPDSNYGQRATKVHGDGKPNEQFIPELAECNEPLHQLLRSDVWSWGDTQYISFQRVKDTQITPETRTLRSQSSYDRRNRCLINRNRGDPATNARRLAVCYASRSLSDTEKRYAVIEREALAATWACVSFVFRIGARVKTDTRD